MCREYILNKVGVWNRKPNYKILLSATSAKEMVLHGHNFLFVSVISLIPPWLTCLNWTHPDLVLLLMSLGVHTRVLSHVWLFVTLWTEARKASLSMGFSRQEYWGGLPGPPPGDLPDPGIKPTSPASPVSAGRYFTSKPPEKPLDISIKAQIITTSVKNLPAMQETRVRSVIHACNFQLLLIHTSPLPFFIICWGRYILLPQSLSSITSI